MGITAPVNVPPSDRAAPAAERVRRVFSLSGVIPLGAFLVLHLVVNALALRGHRTFAAAVAAIQAVPALPLVECVLVLMPLVFHGAVGLWLIADRRTLEPAAPYPRAVRVAMRLTALVTLAFLVAHLPELRFREVGRHLGADELATRLDADLSATSRGVPWAGIAYLAGTACATFHFVCGLWGFYATTEAARGDAARRRWAARGAVVAGLVTWFTFADVVVLRATGTAPLGVPARAAHDLEGDRPCPGP